MPQYTDVVDSGLAGAWPVDRAPVAGANAGHRVRFDSPTLGKRRRASEILAYGSACGHHALLGVTQGHQSTGRDHRSWRVIMIYTTWAPRPQERD